MSPTWIHYRRVTHLGLSYVRGDVTLEDLAKQIEVSLENLKIFSNADGSLVECVAELQEWREYVAACGSGVLSSSALAHWIVYQPLGFPSPTPVVRI